MPLLKTQNTKASYTRKRVDVPEFGTDETGEPYYVFARRLSMSEQKDAVKRAIWLDKDKRRIQFDYPQVAYLGAVGGTENDTDRGTRIFASEQFITDLHQDYEPAIRRIALEVLILSNLISPQPLAADGTVQAVPSEDDPVGDAKKN